MTHMKTATIREAQHNLQKILRLVAQGEIVAITRRNQIVARLIPATQAPVNGLPDFVARARALWGKHPAGKPTSDLVIDGRAERL